VESTIVSGVRSPMANLRRTKSGSPSDGATTPVASMPGKPAASAGRVVSLTVIDQGASSISNFGLSVLVVHGSSAREIGVFAIIITTYILGQGLVRSVTSDCLLTRSGATHELRVRFERAGYIFAFIAASAFSMVVFATAAVVGSSFAVPFVIFAICFPLMALQDFSRYIGISRNDPAYSIRLDVAWIVIFVVAIVGLRSAGLGSLPWLFGAWTGAGALVGLSTVPAFLSVRNGVQALRFWITSEWSVGTRFAGQFLVGTFGAYGALYLLVFVISIDAIGLIKVAQLALAPMVVLFAGAQSALVSIVSRKMRESRQQATRFLNNCGVLMTLAMAIWTVAVYVAPTKDIARVFGPTWVQARPFMLWIGLSAAIGCVSPAYVIGLRSMRSAKELLRLVVIMAPLLLVLYPVGGKIAGIRGVAVGGGVFSLIYAVLAWTIFSRATRRYEVDQAIKPISLAAMLVRQGDIEPVAIADVLAREGLVAPISFADMFAHHGAVEPMSFADALGGHNGTEPISLTDMLARHGAGEPANPAESPAGGNGANPVSFADLRARQGTVELATLAETPADDKDLEPIAVTDMLARQGRVDPITLADMLARQGGVEPITLADMLVAKDKSKGKDGNSKTKG
jgi:O-antigen/teichoic acid export membrane protein